MSSSEPTSSDSSKSDTNELLTRTLASLSRNELLALNRQLAEAEHRRSRNLISTYFETPEVRATYAKQCHFFTLGKTFNERALFGGNRSGKTVAGCFETTLHLTGNYPDWWDGYRFDSAVQAWSAGTTAKKTRDITQTMMLGTPGSAELLGTGFIPGNLILRTTVKHGIADAVETAYVRHVPTGGVSALQFKSYDQGRPAYEGTAQNLIHLDEEPPVEIYVECLLRLMTTSGRLMLTATPLEGLTALMMEFLPEMAPKETK